MKITAENGAVAAAKICEHINMLEKRIESLSIESLSGVNGVEYRSLRREAEAECRGLKIALRWLQGEDILYYS